MTQSAEKINPPEDRPRLLLPCYETLPHWLRQFTRFVLWRMAWDGKRGDWSKIPFKAVSRSMASSTNPADWCGFGGALAVYQRLCGRPEGFGGIGIVLGHDEASGLNLAGVDFDAVVLPTGEILPWAVREIEALVEAGAYAEFSPSGTGLKAVLAGEIDPECRQRAPHPDGGSIEVYGGGRYFALTGRLWNPDRPGSPVDATAVVQDVQRRLCGPRTKAHEPVSVSRSLPQEGGLPDDELLRRMFASKTGGKILALWNGDISGYDSRSEACLALASFLMWWCNNDIARADALFRQSALMYGKWDRPIREGGPTCGAVTLEKARTAGEGYQPRETTLPRLAAVPVSADSGDPDDEPNRDPLDPGPFPDHLLDVGGFLGEVCAFTNARSFAPQPVLALAGGLALMSGLTARKITDGKGTKSNLYVLSVAPSCAGKEAARETNGSILGAFPEGEAMLGPDSWASSAGLVSAVEAQPNAIFQVDELGRYLAAMANPAKSPHLFNIVTELLRLFTTRGAYRGAAHADSTLDKVIHSPAPTLFGTTVPESLFSAMTTDAVTNGFLGRVLIFEGGLPEETRSPDWLEPPNEIIETARSWVASSPGGGNLAKIHPQPRALAATGEVEAGFSELGRLAQAERKRLGEPIGAVWGRAVEKARKLALLVAASRGGVDVETILPDDASWACRLSEYLTRRLAFLALQWVADSTHEDRGKKVLRLLRGAGPDGMTKSRLYNATRSFTPRERDDVLSSLAEAGLISQVVENQPGGGRPRTVFRLARGY